MIFIIFVYVIYDESEAFAMKKENVNSIFTRSRLRVSDRIIAFILALALVITMVPYKSVYANDTELQISGIGINNNVHGVRPLMC